MSVKSYILSHLKPRWFLLWVIPLCHLIPAQAQGDFKATIYVKGYVRDSVNSFWSYSNTNGLLTKPAIGAGDFTPEYTYTFRNEDTLSIGGSVFFRVLEKENDWGVNQAWAHYRHRSLGITVGARKREEIAYGLSGVGGDILWSQNARPIPGILIETVWPLRILENISIEGGLAHYRTFDDRIIQNTNIHYKYGRVNFRLNRTSDLSFGFHHYAQWGGVSEEFGPQPTGMGDYLKIFLGQGEEANPDVNNPENALGNHIGSYRASYTRYFRDQTLTFYHQSVLEDRDGFAFRNFPDGVWGVFLDMPERQYFNAIVYEYIQTTARNGDPFFGADDYFNNSTYESGWTYYGMTIGMPFITPNDNGIGINNNVLKAHHLGVMGKINQFTYRVKGSYVHNFGRNVDTNPVEEQNIYSYFELRYQTYSIGRFGISLGYDVNEIKEDAWSVGLEWRYVIGGDLDGDRCRCRY